MKPLTFLVLTDHRKHSAENSLYALLQSLQQHPAVGQVWVASRGNANNNSFFYDCKNTPLSAVEVDNTFVFDPTGKLFTQKTTKVNSSTVDAIFLRLPRPVSDEFLRFIATIGRGKTLINHPLGIIKTSSKAFLLNLKNYCPPIELCSTTEQVRIFAKQFPTVLKPLREYGGKGIVRIDGNKVMIGNDKQQALDEFLISIEKELYDHGFLAMKFMKNVSQGDKRILVVNGQIMAASLRLPAPNSWMCNVAQGGKSVAAEVTPEEEAMIAAISPILKREGIFIFGADTLVNDNGKRILSEVNTLSIGGFPQAEKQTGKPVVQETINMLINYVISK